jgi:S-layer protein (TIGR01567 family)
MPSHSLVAVILVLLIVTAANAEEGDEIRGTISKVINEGYTWGPQDFSGLYYDINKNIGNEQFHVYITNNNTLKQDTGITYETNRQLEDIAFKEWGEYYSIGFLGEKYFAGYSNDSNLSRKSDCKSPLAEGEISKVLDNNNNEIQISYKKSKMFYEGYKLIFMGFKDNGVFIQLIKDGELKCNEIVEPGNGEKATFTYPEKRDSKGKIVTLALHFKNYLRDSEDINKSILTCDGIFQTSDSFYNIKDGSFDRMKLVNTTKDNITMALKKDISLITNQNFKLSGNIWLRTADQDVLPTDPLRFYIYKKMDKPGHYIIRGPVAPVRNSEITMNADSFAGLYYDLNDNITTEEITLRITGNNQLEEAKGIEYKTHLQPLNFKFEDWGRFHVIGFLGNKYFGGYLDGYLYNKSVNEEMITNLVQSDNLSKVLIDSDKDEIKKSNENLSLFEDYTLSIKSIDVTGNKIYVVLYKNDKTVDDKVMEPSKVNATIEEKTYFYKSSKKLITIAVNFKNSYISKEGNATTIDGVWQISDEFTNISDKYIFNTMEITEKTNDKITMVNRDTITLNGNDKILMDSLKIKISDSNVKNFYLWKDVAFDSIEPNPPG